MRKVSYQHRDDIDGYSSLEELALDFYWSWGHNHAVKKIWQKLDPELWESLKNPWVILQTISQKKLEHLLLDPELRKTIEELISAHRLETQTPTWFAQNHGSSQLTCIAYFSMEFMLG